MICAGSTLFAGSALRLVNDSAFTLEATIISAQGETLASRTISPQNYFQWTYSPPPRAGNYTPSSPYTVVWRCTDGKEFGVSTYVGNAQWAQASTSNGPQYCIPPKKKADVSSNSSQESEQEPPNAGFGGIYNQQQQKNP